MRITLLFILICTSVQAQNSSFSVRYQRITTLLKEHHIEPLTVDDSFSNRLFDFFISEVDKDRALFIQPVIKRLAVHRNTLDDGPQYIKRFLIDVKDELASPVKSQIEWLQNNRGNTLLPSEVIHTRYSDWPLTNQEAITRYASIVKFGILKRSLLVMQQSMTSFESIEEEVRHYEFDLRSMALDSLISDNLEELFLNCIPRLYDSHSELFNGKDSGLFIDELSSERQSFGLEFSINSIGEMVVSRVVPGGAGWNSGRITSGDILTEISTIRGETFATHMMLTYELEYLFVKETSLTLTLKNAIGIQDTVTLTKTRLDNESNFMKAYSLSGPATIGYLPLTSFYTSWEDESLAPKCANDLARELMGLKKLSVQGLILDLRDNGGGSVQEAIEIAGIFIDEGTLCQFIQSADPKKGIIRDRNRGLLYNGPMVVLVNRFTASAAELLAAILQDYHRAIIVGEQTFGKGVGQTLLPLEPVMGDKRPAEMLMVTDRFYFTTNGVALQHHGVIPDINLPSPLRFSGEISLPNSLSIENLPSKTGIMRLPELPIDTLRQLSMNRREPFEEVERNALAEIMYPEEVSGTGFLLLAINGSGNMRR